MTRSRACSSSSANKEAVDVHAPEATRSEAVQLLGLTSYADSGRRLFSLLSLDQPQSVQLAVISALGRFADPQVGPELVKRFDMLTPRLRSSALSALLARADRGAALLQAVAAG